MSGAIRLAPGTARMPKHGAADLDEFRDRMDELWETLGPPSSPATYVAHTDGACLGNPDGPGGWAAVMDSPVPDGRPWELWGHLTSTSNNRAEALAVLAAIEWVPAGSTLRIRSDSELSVKILTGSYRAKQNTDIWASIQGALEAKKLVVQAEWVRGHAGDPGNERADALSVLGAVNGDVERWERQRASSAAAPRRAPRREQAMPPELAGLEPRGSWEEGFVQSIAKQLRAGRALSEKQQAILDRIRARGATSATGSSR